MPRRPSRHRRPLFALLPGLLALGLVAPSAARAAPHSSGRGGPSSILVRFRASAPPSRLEADVRRAGGTRLGTVYGLPVTVVEVPAGRSARGLAARYASLQDVVYAEPNRAVHAAGAPLPDDPSFGQQYGLDNTGQSGGTADADIDAPEGWAAAGLGDFPSAGGVPIGFVDSGIDTSHPEFAGRIAACVHRLDGTGKTPQPGCADHFGHGTHVAGIAAAATNNGQGVAGVSFDSPVMACRALDATGTGTISDVAACLLWLHDHGAKVINMSIVGAHSATMKAAVQAAWDGGSASGSVLVAAAGNTGTTHCEYPACYADVVSVAATDRNDMQAWFSTFNTDVEVSAPGLSVFSTIPGGYGVMSGTSMATPFAAGVAAVIWQLHPRYTALQVRDALDAGVDDLGAPGRDTSFGFGRVNLCVAVGAACPYGAANAGVGSVQGMVTDTNSIPLRAVVVATGPQTVKVRTASNGTYLVPALTPGSYVVKARRKGCTAEKQPVTVTAGETATLDFQLPCSS